MDVLTDYIYALEAVALDSTGEGVCVAPMPVVSSTGTCGCVGQCTAPMPQVTAQAHWAPFGMCTAPMPQVTATTDGYHPAWGECVAPMPQVTAVARGANAGICLAPMPFCTGQTGAHADVTAPMPTVYALSGYNRTAAAAITAPMPRAEAYVCGIDNPISNSATSSEVVALLQQGNIEIADAAATLFAGLASSDAIARAAVRFVAGFSYVSDGSGIGDRWTCALPTYQRRYGDCEDGAILLQSLLLAAGVDPGRVITCFGTVGETSTGHAWTIYRRESDEEWVPLEWTDSAFRTLASVDAVKRMVDRTDTYTGVSYILTSTAFTAITTATWLKRITLLHATASMTAPMPVVTAEVGPVARAFMTAPMPRVTGQTGAAGSCVAPMPRVGATATLAQPAHGACVAPMPVVTAQTGAHGECVAPMPQVTAQTGAAGLCVAPMPTMAATATSRAWVRAAITAPMPVVTGQALAGIVAHGTCVAPMPVVTAGDLPGLAAWGECAAPMPRVEATAYVVSTAQGACVAPMPQVHAHAWVPPDWGVLHYDFRRLA